jgi:hypothetical protein
VPLGTSPEIAARLNTEINVALRDEGVRSPIRRRNPSAARPSNTARWYAKTPKSIPAS